MNRALYAGSFDPFTLGHLDIVLESSKIFDEVFVCIAQNPNKKRTINEYDMADEIRNVVKRYNIKNVRVVICDGLVADYCAKNYIKYLIRGLRNTSDYMYEENIAKINTEVNPELRTVYFRANNEVISSSMVKELYNYGKDIRKYLPNEILKFYYNEV